MSDDAFREDGQVLRRYGHRSDGRGGENNFYRDEAMNVVDEHGASFWCRDAPQIRLPAEKEDKVTRMELEFLGQLVDTGSSRVLQERTWEGKYVHVPEGGRQLKRSPRRQPEVLDVREAPL
ncbi:MAG: hypothetical protein ACRDJO_09205 [Actinomycetota bacterium]